jgi:hypothetical protein
LFALCSAGLDTRDVWLKSYRHAELVLDPARASGRGYCTDVCFKIHARAAGGERLVISGISSERICALISPPAAS